MNVFDLKQFAKKGYPYLLGILALIVVIQGYCLARLYQQRDKAKIGTDDKPLVLDSMPTPLVPDIFSLGQDDPWQNSLFNRSFDPNDWDPFQEMKVMQDRMNGLFGDAFGRLSQSPSYSPLFDSSWFTPQIDVQDKGDCFVIKIDLPGAEKSNIDISCQDQTVTISGSLDQMQQDTQGGSLLRHERRSGRFSRSIPLPAPIQSDLMETECAKGIVTVTIPKAMS